VERMSPRRVSMGEACSFRPLVEGGWKVWTWAWPWDGKYKKCIKISPMHQLPNVGGWEKPKRMDVYLNWS
jgi:hypothetical protein